MLTKDLNAIKFLNKCIELNACDESIKWIKNEINKKNKTTIEDILQKNINTAWADWTLKIMGNYLDINLRKILINKIENPMMSFMLYLKCSFLEKEEQNMLLGKFKNKLPTAEKQLKEGRISKCQ